jgi:TolB-like protein
MNRLWDLIAELRRRKTFRSAGIYVVAAWVGIQVASLIFPAVGIPDSALIYVWLIALVVFPLVIVFAWRYDLTAEGVTRTAPASANDDFDPALRRADYVILTSLAAVAISVGWQLTARVEPFSDTDKLAANPNSVAVLPFDNISGDPEQEYFASGMQSALIANLSRIRALRVTSKTSTLRYRNSSETLPEIGRQLSVAKIIEGSIYRFKNRVRLEVRLLDAKEDSHVWSASFEDEIDDVLILQSRAAQAIAGQVRVTLSPDEQAQFDNPRRIDSAAYDAFLK